MRIASFSARCEALLGWYRAHARAFPWRMTRDPYRIWISEIMLQQTRAETVLLRYEPFLRRFPDVASLAATSLDAVLVAWEGLGYYRRARLLHEAARLIMQRHGGIFPSRFEDILALPGVGRSTAGAIASIAFGLSKPVLDGNVRRVLVRWLGEVPPMRVLWDEAARWVEAASSPGDWNQAMMELGATVCLPRAPRCAACPARDWCRAKGALAEQTRPRKAPRPLALIVRLHHDPARGIWLVQQPQGGIWGGLWTPPFVQAPNPPSRKPDCVHLLTHRRLLLFAESAKAAPQGPGRWSREGRFALPVGIRRLLAAIGWENRL